MDRTPSKEKLINHWWYRLLNVAYIFIIVFLLVIVSLFAWGEKPKIDKLASTYQIKCYLDGTLGLNISGSDLNHYGKLSHVYDGGTKLARWACHDPKRLSLTKEQAKMDFAKAFDEGTIPDADNFEIIMKDPSYVGGWDKVLMKLILGSVGVLLLSWIVRSIFFYIFIGETPQIPSWKKITN